MFGGRLVLKGLSGAKKWFAVVGGSTKTASHERVLAGALQLHPYAPAAAVCAPAPTLREFSVRSLLPAATAVVTANDAESASGVEYLQQAVGITVENTLVNRLAAVWRIPPEILHSNVQALQALLQPCGCDTTAQALWMLVRSPGLRKGDEHQYRAKFRQLQRLVDHLNMDRRVLLSAIYKRPWVLAAINAPSTSNTAAAFDRAGFRVQQTDIPVYDTWAAWKHELALFALEVQASNDSSNSSSSSVSARLRASNALALSAVRAYLMTKEVAQFVAAPIAAVTETVVCACTDDAASAVNIKPAPVTTCAPAAQMPTVTDSCTAAAAASEQRSAELAVHPAIATYIFPSAAHQQRQQQQLQLLQQLLATCPQYLVLPPERLAMRWQLLLSGLLGEEHSAAQLLMTNTYLMVDYTDLPQDTWNGPCRAEWEINYGLDTVPATAFV